MILYDIIMLVITMFTKNNLKYILILAIGFFWCSSVYLTQEQYLLNYANESYVNIVELLFGSLAMALGILIFGLLQFRLSSSSLWSVIASCSSDLY